MPSSTLGRRADEVAVLVVSDDSLVAAATQMVRPDPYSGAAPTPFENVPRPLQPRQPGLSRYAREILRKLWLVILLGIGAGTAVYVLRSEPADTFESTAVARVVVAEEADDGSITAFQSQQIAELALTQRLMTDAASRAGLDISATEAQRLTSVDQRSTPGFLDIRALGPSRGAAERLAQGTADSIASAGSQIGGLTISVIQPAASARQVSNNAIRDALLAALVMALVTSALIILARKARGRISPISPENEIERISGVPTVRLDFNDQPGGATAPFFSFHLYEAPVITVLQRSGPATVEFASSLAETAASFSRRVMVIDSDTVKPILHERFGYPQTPGLADVLAGLEPLRNVVRRASETNPTAVLTAGSGASELIGVERIIGIHRIVTASGADCAIVSTTSNSNVHDALMVAHHFPEAVVLSLDPKRTTEREIRELTNSVHSVGGRLVGIVLHDGGRLGPNAPDWRQKRASRRSHMRSRVARDWSER